MDSFAARATSAPGLNRGRRAGERANQPNVGHIKPENDALNALLAGSSKTFRQPNTWTGILIASLAVIVVFQKPLARSVGTEGHAVSNAPAAAAVAVAPVSITPTLATRPGTRPDVTGRTARNPFSPLVSSTGAGLAPTTIPATNGSTSGSHTGSKTNPSGGASKSGTGKGGTTASCASPHLVRAGESLWSISAESLSATGYSNVTAAWHALYSANRDTIGSDPAYLAVGERLCLPSA